MSISDEQLSAFLDAELPEQEMERVREALIADDETLTNRLADLALVDQLVRDSYRSIDQLPLPAGVTSLLAQESPRASAEVIAFPWWRRVGRGLQSRAAVAACVVLALGFIAVRLLPTGQQADWSYIADVLETAPSGVEQALDEGVGVTPQLTFQNRQGLYCRQFQVRRVGQPAEQSIACRQGADWQPVASVYLQQPPQQGYQTATGDAELEQMLDRMMQGEPFDAAQESRLIDRHWLGEME